MTRFFCCFVLMLLALRGSVARADDRPDIVLFLFDAARADFFASYGARVAVTPNIDALAAQGAVFRNHISNGFYTRASLAHLFTSRYETYPILNYFDDPDYPWWIRDEVIASNVAFLPAVLRAGGYRTVMVTGHSFTTPDSALGKSFGEVVMVPPRDNQPAPIAEDVFAQARAVLERRKAGEPPLFLYIHLLDTHMPHDARGVDRKFLTGSVAKLSDQEIRKLTPAARPNAHASLTNTQKQILVEEARGAYAYLDRQFAAFYRAAKPRLRRRTVWAITSDHGDAYGEENFVGHSYGTFAMDELHRVPFFLWGEGVIPARARVEQLTQTLDIFPTILSIAGVELPRGKRIEGVSLLSLLRTKSTGEVHPEGVVSIFRVGFRKLRAAVHLRDRTLVLTEADEAFEHKRGKAGFTAARLPLAIARRIESLRGRDARRTSAPRGRLLNVPLTEYVFSDRASARSCWGLGGWRTYQKELTSTGKSECNRLDFSVTLPSETMTLRWNMSVPKETCRNPAKVLGSVQTSGSAKPIPVTCKSIERGSLDAGVIRVAKDSLSVHLRLDGAARVTIGGMRLVRTDASLPNDPALSEEERERLRSLGYIN